MSNFNGTMGRTSHVWNAKKTIKIVSIHLFIDLLSRLEISFTERSQEIIHIYFKNKNNAKS